MRLPTLLLLSLLSLYGYKDAHQAQATMTWEDGYRYCFSMNAQLASIDNFEAQFALERSGKRTGIEDATYWTRDMIDIDGAYSFEFNLGAAMPDHKAKKYRVLCVK